jgi:pimeloyl-ACP methyl ester carboxylesterase
MIKLRAASLCLSGLIAAGCSSNGSVGPTDPTSGNGAPAGTPATGTFKAQFEPLAGILPYPTDLYFSGSTDGTLNLKASSFQPNGPGVNELDGYGVNQLISVRFANGDIAPASLSGTTVRMIEVAVDPATKATVSVVRPLAYGVDYSAGLAAEADAAGGLLDITPLKPLNAKSGYLVILTDGITNSSGAAAAPDTDYANIKTALGGGASCPSITDTTLNGICRLTGANLKIAGALGIAPANVILTFSFSTQSIGDTLAVVAAGTQVLGAAVQATGLATNQINPQLFGHANVYVGAMAVPYFLNRTAPLSAAWVAAPDAEQPTAGLLPPSIDPASRFLTRYKPLPKATETVQIPVLLTVPNANALSGGVKPANGWPVVIFQHGVTRSRLDMFAIADSYADAGFAVVAIDLPLHGATDKNSPLYQAGRERTLDLDLANNATGAAGADGVIDSSGSYFINLKSFPTSRDNARQGAADILTLAKTLPFIDIDGDTVPDFDAAKIHFIGQSLGSIIGAVSLAYAGSNIKTAVLNVPGGRLVQLLESSPSFGPAIRAGLTSAGLTPGTTLFKNFLRDGQTIIDAADPIDYISAAAAARPTLLQQVVGGGILGNGAASLPDQVIPNAATALLIAAGGFSKITTPGINANAKGYVNFIFGGHGSILDPSTNLAATVEMQGEAVKFTASNGAAVVISDPTVIQAP